LEHWLPRFHESAPRGLPGSVLGCGCLFCRVPYHEQYRLPPPARRIRPTFSENREMVELAGLLEAVTKFVFCLVDGLYGDELVAC
jgi:hypothetical protein